MSIFFVGAGPGDPELITVKGKRILGEADIIVYTGSLVNPEILGWAKKSAMIYDSAPLDLEEIIGIIREGHENNQIIVRLHTGDPSIFGAINEEMEALEEIGTNKYEVIPGISSFLAAAARLKTGYTIPEISQSLIITRRQGRTKVPEKENLKSLSSHGTSMAIFLSAGMIGECVQDLLAGGYPEHTPAAVIYRATWPDEIIIKGSLSDIVQKAEEMKIKKTALILVGDFLEARGKKSRLYDKNFSHGYR